MTSQNAAVERYPSDIAAPMRRRCSSWELLVAIDTTQIHNDQLVDWTITSRLASDTRRHSSDMPCSRPSGDDRSTASSTSVTAAIAASISGRCSSWAISTRTSAWKSAWFRQMRRMTEALVSWRPVSWATRSNTRLKVRLLDVVSRPSSSRMVRPVASRIWRSSRLLWRFRARPGPPPASPSPEAPSPEAPSVPSAGFTSTWSFCTYGSPSAGSPSAGSPSAGSPSAGSPSAGCGAPLLPGHGNPTDAPRADSRAPAGRRRGRRADDRARRRG